MDKLYTMEEASELLKMNRIVLYKKYKAEPSKYPFFMIARKLVITETDLQSIIETSRTESFATVKPKKYST